MNKYWRPIKREELEEMGLNEIENAIQVSGLPDGVKNWVWEKKRNLGDVF